MKKSLLKIVAALVAGSVFATPVISDELSPVGKWRTATGESQYEVTLCGGGANLCAKLIWLRADARTADNIAYLNKYVVHGARPIAANKWRGIINYAGEKIGGSMTLLSVDKLRLNGCKLILCQTMDFNRV